MIIHSTHLHPSPTARHKRAQQSWRGLDMTTVHQQFYRRSSKDIGDQRMLPYFNDLMDYAIRHTKHKDDIILWCNDDVQLDSRIIPWCGYDVIHNGAMSMRRIEPGGNGVHMGRELFAFRVDWLKENLSSFPDFIIGSPFFDLVLAAIIRAKRGHKSTVANMTEDIPLCDSAHRFAIHEPHQSSWAGNKEHYLPGNLHNKKLAKAWCLKNMPSLCL